MTGDPEVRLRPWWRRLVRGDRGPPSRPTAIPTEPARGTDTGWMVVALEAAREAARHGEVPVGAVLVRDETVLARAHNAPIGTHDPTAHAEIRVLRAGGERLGNYRLLDTTLYVTLEPCPMCVGALVHARVARVVFGATDPRRGALISPCSRLGSRCFNHRPRITAGVGATESRALLQAFFRARRRGSPPRSAT